MADSLKDVLTKHIDEAIAMEENVARMLDSMIETTDDPEIKQGLERHKQETEQQSDRLRERLEAHGAETSKVREAGGIVGALMTFPIVIWRTSLRFSCRCGRRPGRCDRRGRAHRGPEGRGRKRSNQVSLRLLFGLFAQAPVVPIPAVDAEENRC